MNYKKLIATALAFGCVITTVPVHNAQAATIKIGYGGQTRYYNGKQLTFDYKGTKLSSSYVGIQIDKVNMVPYYDYLVKQGPKVKRTYTKSNGKLVLKYGNNTLTAYAGNKTYYLNGVKKTFSVAPTKVKYYSTGKTIILMPANATITKLGLKYNYDSSAKRISINPKAVTVQGSSSSNSSTLYTDYGTSLSSYVKAEQKEHPSYSGKKITESTYKKYIDPSKDTTNNYQFLRLNTYRPVNATTYNKLLNNNLKSGSVLKDKGDVLIAAAKKYNIDPVYLLCQTILETGYGQSTLSQGKSITKVVADKYLVKTDGKVTNIKRISSGSYDTKKVSSKKVYNLYGIKAYDIDPQLCGFSWAYYQDWTSVDKAIYGAAQYVSEQYINSSTHKQNTLYKFRYHPDTSSLWHEYATDPEYAEKIASIMYSKFKSAYTASASFTYDKPKFK